jgi:hypothetical protein
VIIGAILITDEGRKALPVRNENAILDALSWIPATEASTRAFAAWSAQPGDPLNAIEALERLDPEPVPLLFGRSTDWQVLTGTSAGDFTGWASAGNHGPTVLVGEFDETGVSSALRSNGYVPVADDRGTIWIAPENVIRSATVNGDDLRALAAIAVMPGRIIVGMDHDSVLQGLRAGHDERDSLADLAQAFPITSFSAGLQVVDQRDLAIQCGVGSGWDEGDFPTASGFWTRIIWTRGSSSVTSVGVAYADELTALAGLTPLESEWRTGFVNGRGLGAAVADLANVDAVYQNGPWVVADLSNGRENGWTRSGVRFLIEICEEAARLIPAGLPVSASPVASPAAME